MYAVFTEKCIQRYIIKTLTNEKALRGDATTARWLYTKADPQTNKQTQKQTGAITIHCAA